MQLDRINKTNDIKKLNLEEKLELSSEIRNYLLEVVSQNGGHLASNLGVVELTIALESVFDVSCDKIVWDVGHQCYVHKILNGRKEKFKTLREFGGISGFPNTNESITDAFNTGHSSTSISVAMGFAKARDILKKKNHVIAVIGDGASTGGMALEALNHVGSNKTNMIVVLNDNEMSISKNIGGMNQLLTNLRVRKKYRQSNIIGKKAISNIPVVGTTITGIVSRIKDGFKQLIIPGMYFEEIGFRYLGPVDGHDIATLEDIFRRAKELDGPILIHVITKKGKGYRFAEESPDKFHGVSSFDVETGQAIKFSKSDYSKIFGKKLVSLAKKNKKIVAITAAMKDGTGLGEFSSKYPERFFDVGIAEQHAITFAAGLASSGMIPFVSIYSSFYQRCFDQIIHDVCIQKLPVVMCVDRAGIVGNDGATHQGIYDLSFFKVIPDIAIIMPRDFKELEVMLEFAVDFKSPLVIRYPRGGESIIPYKRSKIVLGKSDVLVKGGDVSIITIGSSVSKGYELSTKLSQDGYNPELINARFMKPFDTRNILKSIKKTKRVIVIEDCIEIGGLCSEIKELISTNNLSNIDAIYFAYPDNFIEHGSVEKIEKKYKMDTTSIYKKSVKMLKKTIKTNK